MYGRVEEPTLENVRQIFDRERETYLSRIQALEKELAAEKEPRTGSPTTAVRAVSGSKREDTPICGGAHLWIDMGELV